jgi:hypothetical protein
MATPRLWDLKLPQPRRPDSRHFDPEDRPPAPGNTPAARQPASIAFPSPNPGQTANRGKESYDRPYVPTSVAIASARIFGAAVVENPADNPDGPDSALSVIT